MLLSRPPACPALPWEFAPQRGAAAQSEPKRRRAELLASQWAQRATPGSPWCRMWPRPTSNCAVWTRSWGSPGAPSRPGRTLCNGHSHWEESWRRLPGRHPPGVGRRRIYRSCGGRSRSRKTPSAFFSGTIRRHSSPLSPLSSRPKRSVAKGPAVLSSNSRVPMKAPTSPLPSRLLERRPGIQRAEATAHCGECPHWSRQKRNGFPRSRSPAWGARPEASCRACLRARTLTGMPRGRCRSLFSTPGASAATTIVRRPRSRRCCWTTRRRS